MFIEVNFYKEGGKLSHTEQIEVEDEDTHNTDKIIQIIENNHPVSSLSSYTFEAWNSNFTELNSRLVIK